jgi:hypothetical protein
VIRARPYIASGLDQQGRVQQTNLQRWEDDAGTCNTCPGELHTAECLFQREPVRRPPPVPWRALGAGLAIVFLAVGGLHVVNVIWPPAITVAAR